MSVWPAAALRCADIASAQLAEPASLLNSTVDHRSAHLLLFFCWSINYCRHNLLPIEPIRMLCPVVKDA